MNFKAAAGGGGRVFVRGATATDELPPAVGTKPGCPGKPHDVNAPSTAAGWGGGTGHGHVHGTPDFRYWKTS